MFVATHLRVGSVYFIVERIDLKLMEDKKPSSGQGNTSLLKTVQLKLTVVMEPHETVEELVDFTANFFLTTGDYRGVEIEAIEDDSCFLIPQEETSGEN